MRYLLLLVALATIVGCSGVTYPVPISLHASCSIGDPESYPQNSSIQMPLAARMKNGSTVLCAKYSKESCMVRMIDTSMHIVWKRPLLIPEDNEHIALTMGGNTISVLFNKEDGDTIMSELVDRTNGSYVLASIRDSVDDSPKKSPVRYNETTIVSSSAVLQRQFTIADVFEKEKAEEVGGPTTEEL